MIWKDQTDRYTVRVRCKAGSLCEPIPESVHHAGCPRKAEALRIRQKSPEMQAWLAKLAANVGHEPS